LANAFAAAALARAAGPTNRGPGDELVVDDVDDDDDDDEPDDVLLPLPPLTLPDGALAGPLRCFAAAAVRAAIILGVDAAAGPAPRPRKPRVPIH
jgi:hypothetical protein